MHKWHGSVGKRQSLSPDMWQSLCGPKVRQTISRNLCLPIRTVTVSGTVCCCMRVHWQRGCGTPGEFRPSTRRTDTCTRTCIIFVLAFCLFAKRPLKRRHFFCKILSVTARIYLFSWTYFFKFIDETIMKVESKLLITLIHVTQKRNNIWKKITNRLQLRPILVE